MRRFYLSNTIIVMLLLLVLPAVIFAQDEKFSYGRPAYWRPYDKSGINVFETSKDNLIPYDGMRIRLGAGFTQQYQNLKHENPGASNYEGSNKLYPLAPGFMTAMANLNIDVQLAEGIRLNVTTYLSTRHHNEAWVKGGYIQFDKLPFNGKFWDNLMKVTTIKVGHMEVNYGDAHFRRSDGGQTLYNPFMESYIMDGYATEIGGEVYVQKNGLFGMLGVTNGMIKGNVDSAIKSPVDDNVKRNPSIIVKGGIDKKIGDVVRVRLSGSLYHNSNSSASGLTLYGGDRAGSNYQNVMENVPAGAALPASTSIAFSGRLNPGFTKKVDAYMINGFLKVQGLELFGTYENAQGRSKNETAVRLMQQYAGDVVYRFCHQENLFVGVRYNYLTGRLAGMANDINIDRFAAAGGWFVTKNVLLKGEYVIQKYNKFPVSDYRSSGKFNGYVVEAVVGF
ncbi:hypothetical protein A4D02_24650 [Niastella koreensis]|uniref:Phosphate-selective porin O and P n=2 Tax=Niastella koreensis TaxID=354356 RepID=G8TET7_NIAKG|nr:hypothetical protein [Niastella koreensis]AEW00523.1 hypothetical protein Niako_4251 [Niastella koreensis GR20-10]OQP52383.1 hypothetical protein A4D02_24650 [Niastella koreensis]